jgi:hypothetical protein
MASVRRQVQAIDRDQPVQAIQTLAQVLSSDRWWYRTWGGVFAAFAIIALVLSSVGLHAVMSWSCAPEHERIVCQRFSVSELARAIRRSRNFLDIQ